MLRGANSAQIRHAHIGGKENKNLSYIKMKCVNAQHSRKPFKTLRLHPK